MLELKSLSKKYKKQTVFSGMNETLGAGVTILTGPSGVGKSTLLRLCASAEKPSSGEVLWDGLNIHKRPKPFRALLGYAPQIIDFPEDLSASDFMLHIAAMKSIKAKPALSQTEQLFERLGLLRDIDKKIGSYSGGMRRRLGVAQAFLGTPKCLIIDEPTAELDPETAKKVHALIFETAQTATILMTTHIESGLKDYDFKALHMDGSNRG